MRILTFFLILNAFLLNAQKDTTKLNVAIFLYPGVELLDFAGPLEVFANTSNMRVFTVAADTGRLYSMQKSMNILPDYTIETSPEVDILVIPGADGESILRSTSNPKTVNWIKKIHDKSIIAMSVCTGTLFYAKAGVLDNKNVTTHWGATNILHDAAPKSTIIEDVRFVLDGKMLTTAGVSAGIDGALFLVSKLRGEIEAKRIARSIEYDKWDPAAGFITGKSKLEVRKKPKKVFDPICRMSLIPEDVHSTKQYGKEVVSFCSAHCQATYEANLKSKK
ncbi:DJ-1/PfpI family protein [Aquirufa antheringensis]